MIEYEVMGDEDAITAFDLCRINQLCGDYYVCGYMTYEETMDISLEIPLSLSIGRFAHSAALPLL